MKSVCSNTLFKVANWIQEEKTEMTSKFESRFIKTVRTVVVLAALLTIINLILVLRM
jgi:hypothetical protein